VTQARVASARAIQKEITMSKTFSVGIGPTPFAAGSDAFDHLVRHTLGQYLGIEPDGILPSQRLREHLDMKTVDIALVLLRLEDIARAHFPQASTQLVLTVADVTELFRAVFGARSAGSATAHVRP
jgi:hypothetical protein